MRDLARAVSDILGVVLVFLVGEMVLALAEKLPSARNNTRAEAIERKLIVTWVYSSRTAPVNAYANWFFSGGNLSRV
jgi:hypothetical protein